MMVKHIHASEGTFRLQPQNVTYEEKAIGDPQLHSWLYDFDAYLSNEGLAVFREVL